MNRLLADAVGFINGFLAICIIAVGTLAGGIAMGAGGALLGFVAGSIVAIVACGLLAVAIDIRNTCIRSRISSHGKPAGLQPSG
jgi:hypothetical protein